MLFEVEVLMCLFVSLRCDRVCLSVYVYRA